MTRSRPLLVWLAIVHVTFVLLWGVRAAGWLQPLELAAYDAGLRMRGGDAAESERVVVVGITEDDVRHYRWPLNDGVLARAVDALAGLGATAIGVDLYRDTPIAPGTQALREALDRHPNVFWILKFGDDAGAAVAPPEPLRGTDRVGFNDVVLDAGGIVRRGLLFLDDGRDVSFAFALRLALAHLAPRGIGLGPARDDPQQVSIGGTDMPRLRRGDAAYQVLDDGGYQFLLDFREAGGSMPRVGLGELLDGAVDAGRVRGRVALIGVTASSINDYFHTPLDTGTRSRVALYGIELQAQITAQLLRAGLDGARPVRYWRAGFETAWLWLWCVAGGGLGWWLRRPGAHLLALALGTAGLAATGMLALDAGWWIPAVPPILAWLLCAGLTSAYRSRAQWLERRALMRIFERHVSADVAATLWERRDSLIDSGRLVPDELTATVLFTDLRDFTRVSERMTPAELMRWLNEYMETMASIVIDHGGTIDKYIGDAIMAVFGVPLKRQRGEDIEGDARNAVRCAVAMAAAMDSLNAHWQAEGQPQIGMRVGIHTGALVAGTLGSERRVDYTVVGDTVNTASRLESFDKNLYPQEHCRILISDATRRLLDGSQEIERVGAVTLKGKDERIDVFHVVHSRTGAARAVQEGDHA